MLTVLPTEGSQPRWFASSGDCTDLPKSPSRLDRARMMASPNLRVIQIGETPARKTGRVNQRTSRPDTFHQGRHNPQTGCCERFEHDEKLNMGNSASLKFGSLWTYGELQKLNHGNWDTNTLWPTVNITLRDTSGAREPSSQPQYWEGGRVRRTFFWTTS